MLVGESTNPLFYSKPRYTPYMKPQSRAARAGYSFSPTQPCVNVEPSPVFS
jgi:hypothetical protein